MSEWKEYRLGDVCARLSSGKNIKANLITKVGKYPVFGGNGLRGYTDTFNFSGQCAIIGRQGAMCGNVRYFSGEGYMTEHAIVLVANNKASTRFLSYKLSLLNLGRLSGQSAQPGLAVGVLANQSISLPPLTEQKKIAAILSSLDEKIETNRKITARLEELAQAIFKSWFVDFEPFGSQMPPNWQYVTLSDIGDIVGGATPSKDHPEYYVSVGNGIAWLTPKDLSDTKAKFTSRGADDITPLGYKKSSTKIMPCGSILFSSRAPIGYISIALNDLCTNQGFKSFIPRKVGTAFSYYLLKALTPEIERKSTGSTFKEASASLMKSLHVFLPDEIILNKFEDFCRPIFNTQRDLEQESARLAELRDALLPKLMSGELKPE